MKALHISIFINKQNLENVSTYRWADLQEVHFTTWATANIDFTKNLGELGNVGDFGITSLQWKGKEAAGYHLVSLSFPAEFPHGKKIFELEFRWLQCLIRGPHDCWHGWHRYDCLVVIFSRLYLITPAGLCPPMPVILPESPCDCSQCPLRTGNTRGFRWRIRAAESIWEVG